MKLLQIPIITGEKSNPAHEGTDYTTYYNFFDYPQRHSCQAALQAA